MRKFFKEESMTVSRKDARIVLFGERYIRSPVKMIVRLIREYRGFQYLESYYWVIHQIYWSLPGKYHFIRAIPNPALYLLYIYFVITPHLFLLDYLYAKVRSKLCPIQKNKLP